MKNQAIKKAEEAERQRLASERQPAAPEEEESDEDYFLKMHMGLIKI